MGDNALELLKYGGDSIIEWLLRIFNRCMKIVTKPEDWKSVIPVHKGRGDTRELANYRRTNIRSTTGKLYC